MIGASIPFRNYPGVSIDRAKALYLARLAKSQGHPILGVGLSTARLVRLEWDSGILGMECSRLDFVTAPDLQIASQLAARTTEFGGDHISVRFDAEDSHLIGGFAENGYEVVDTINTFVIQTSNLEPFSSENLIRMTTPADAVAVREIARKAFKVDRFHSDPLIPKDLADEIHAQWGYNSVMGSAADAVVIGEDENGRVVGFVTCRIQIDTAEFLRQKIGTIVLVATDPNAQGKGTGTKMVRSALNWFIAQGCDLVDVGTQASNERARKLYENTGFCLKATLVSFRWSNLKGHP